MASGTDSGLFSKFQERLRRMRIARGKRRRDEDIYINKKVEEIHKVVGKERVEKRDRYVNDSSDKDAINKLQSDDSLLNKKNKKISVSSDELDSFKKDGALEIKIDSLILEQEKMFRKINLTYRLLEQLYSDLEFTSITDVKRSDALKLFYRVLRSGRMID